jgi:hypothetical protein
MGGEKLRLSRHLRWHRSPGGESNASSVLWLGGSRYSSPPLELCNSSKRVHYAGFAAFDTAIYNREAKEESSKTIINV